MSEDREFEPAPGVRGFWVIPQDTFLYSGHVDDKMLTITLPSGETCHGFSVEVVSKAFGISPGDLLINNQIGNLAVHKVDFPTDGIVKSTSYIFALSLGGVTSEITTVVHRAPVAGRA